MTSLYSKVSQNSLQISDHLLQSFYEDLSDDSNIVISVALNNLYDFIYFPDLILSSFGFSASLGISQ